MTTKNIAFVIILVALGWVAHTGLVRYSHSSQNSGITQVREDSLRFKYINPLIYIDNSDYTYEELDPLKKQVEEYINKEISNKNAERVSFYYRDLNKGMWTGVHPDDKFVPASILKVMTVMVYLRAAEDNPNVINEKLLYKNTNDKLNYPPSVKLKDGYYDVRTLIGQSIVESDNDAEYALYQNKVAEHDALYNILRMPAPSKEITNFISPTQISRIFRSLYSSSYLLNSYSEQTLEFLTQTKFNKGITQHIPPDIKVAHKFGEYADYHSKNTSPNFQLHDCGIVYYPEKPYFICVMTEGKKIENLEKIIGDISAMTLEFVKQS